MSMAMIKKTLRLVVLTLTTILVVMLPISLVLDCGKRADKLQVSTDDALFDTQHKPVGVNLPSEVKAFLSTLRARFEAHDLDGVMEHFSDDFFHQGKTKPMFRENNRIIGDRPRFLVVRRMRG